MCPLMYVCLPLVTLFFSRNGIHYYAGRIMIKINSAKKQQQKTIQEPAARTQQQGKLDENAALPGKGETQGRTGYPVAKKLVRPILVGFIRSQVRQLKAGYQIHGKPISVTGNITGPTNFDYDQS